jgi:hypothetical protein
MKDSSLGSCGLKSDTPGLGFPDDGLNRRDNRFDDRFYLDAQGFLGERAGAAGSDKPHRKLPGFFLEADELDVSAMGLEGWFDFFFNDFLDRFYGVHDAFPPYMVR